MPPSARSALFRRAATSSSSSSRRAAERRSRSVYAAIVALVLCAFMVLAQMLGEDVVDDEEDILDRFFAGTPPRPEGSVTWEDHWQKVERTADRFYVFSAFVDERRARLVRIIGAARTRLTDRVVCSFYLDGAAPFKVLASMKLIRENWNLRYSAFFVLCPLPRWLGSRLPDAVAVLKLNDKGPPGNVLQVHRRGQREGDIAVCVKPIHYEYNKVLQLTEFVELNRVLGVSHFVLYNHTAGADVSCLLEGYQRQGLVTLLPWQLPMLSQREIRTEGLFAALNDCLYRTMYRFRWVAMIDLDEFIVPSANVTLPVLLRDLLRAHPAHGAFSFRNAFFYLQWPDDPLAPSLPLITLRKTRRKTHLHAHRQRSKCIVAPEKVVEMGNHFVWEFVADKGTVNVATDVAFLHHYRVCEFGGDDCVNTTWLRDRTLYFWKDELLAAVTRALQGLETKQLTCPDQVGLRTR